MAQLAQFTPPFICISMQCHAEDAPDPAEIFTVVRVSETKVALKSAYGRYVGVNTAGELVGRAEAMGPRETWEPVFEEVWPVPIPFPLSCLGSVSSAVFMLVSSM